MLYRLIPLSLFLFLSSMTFGQIEFGARLNIGASKISNNFEAVASEHKVDYGASFLIGVYADKALSENTSLSTELILDYISGSETSETNFLDASGAIIGVRNGTDTKKITYLSIPLYYGFRMNKITINGGFQVGVVVSSSGRSRANGFNGTSPIFFDNQLDKLFIDKFTFGPRLGILLRISDSISLDGNYYYGINNIANSEIPWEWRVQQFSFGLRYEFEVNKD